MISVLFEGRRTALRASSAFAGRLRSAWSVTLLATVASTYALDAVAVVVGALLVASGALAQLDRGFLISLLAVTYLLWAAGLCASLAANWSLLASTGLSTNALSKAAHDGARRCGAGSRMRRFAASGGYLLVEAAKEVPYYASAFGASLLSDLVSSSDAIIFLAGTNVGAAIYEYGLARGTRAFLRHRAAA